MTMRKYIVTGRNHTATSGARSRKTAERRFTYEFAKRKECA